MEKVEVVIKIPKYYLTHPQDYTCLAECVRRGVLLPKGHGRLIDAGSFADVLNNAQIEGLNTYKGLGRAKELLIEATTMIEADKEKE